MTLGQNFDTTLIAAKTGAEWAWTALYREFAPGLRRYLRARGAVDADNTLGEVFVRVVKKVPDFEGTESEFKAWLFAIARNRLIDEARYRDRRPTLAPLDAGIHGSVEPDPQGAEPLSDLVRSQVREVLDHLTVDQRDVLFLRILAGLTIEETALVLDKTDGSIKQLQARGLRSLRGKIAEGVVSL